MRVVVTLSVPYDLIRQLEGMEINRSDVFRMAIRDVIEKKELGTTCYEKLEKTIRLNREYKKEIVRLKRKVNKLLKLKGVA